MRERERERERENERERERERFNLEHESYYVIILQKFRVFVILS